MALLPEIPAWLRQPGLLVTIAGQKVSGDTDERAVEGLDEFDFPERLEVLPEGPEDEGGLVLLDRQLLSAIAVPGQPARGERPVRVVLVKKIPFWSQRPGAELEEQPG